MISWRDDAACLPHPNYVEYPTYRQQLICADCPVRNTCLEAALDEEAGGRPEDDWPVRGGLDGRQRAQLLQGRQRPPKPIRHGTEAGAQAHWRRKEKMCEPCRQAVHVARRERERAS